MVDKNRAPYGGQKQGHMWTFSGSYVDIFRVIWWTKTGSYVDKNRVICGHFQGIIVDKKHCIVHDNT